MRQESYKERQSQLKESGLAQGAKTRVKLDLLFENVSQVQKNLIGHQEKEQKGGVKEFYDMFTI